MGFSLLIHTMEAEQCQVQSSGSRPRLLRNFTYYKQELCLGLVVDGPFGFAFGLIFWCYFFPLGTVLGFLCYLGCSLFDFGVFIWRERERYHYLVEEI